MTDAWHVAKWVSIAVTVVYVGFQILAERRLEGDYKKRSRPVLISVLVATMIQGWIDGAFENPAASRMALLAVGVVAGVATVVLARMLQSQNAETESGVSR